MSTADSLPDRPPVPPTAPASPAAPMRRNLPLLLLRAREAVLARFRPIFNEHGLTDQQWRIARLLQEAGPLEPRQMVDAVQIVSASLAGVLARMEEADLVTRRRIASDQRRVLVSLTARGHGLVDLIAPRTEQAYAALEAEIGPELIAALYGLSDRLIERLGQSGQGSQAGWADPRSASASRHT